MAIDAVFLDWSPQGRTLGLADQFRLVDIHDGDTPAIRMPIRMLSVDTPEITSEVPSRAREWDRKLRKLAGWIESGQAPVEPGLAAALLPRLAHGRAGSLQFEQGLEAAAWNRDRFARRLERGRRNLFVRTANQAFDDNNRLLAYVAPNYTPTERRAMSRKKRSTFNLDLIEAGWGAPFMIYPSLPGGEDMALFVAAAEAAVTRARGIWADPLSLPAYEYRMVEKLYRVTKRIVAREAVLPDERKGWRSRLCIDMETRQIFGPEAYGGIPHHRRLWVWPRDVEKARRDFGLTDA